jgi:peptidoglycan/xylan/chitin deacetylase (PgdA/CDA1 family)
MIDVLRTGAKSVVFRVIREHHRRWHMQSQLPTRVAIYMHSVDLREHDALRGVIQWLHELGYRFVTPQEFASAPAGARKAFLSFDDNFRAWLDLLPLLDQERVPATFYVNAEPLRDMATVAQVRAYFDRICHSGERMPLSSRELLDLVAAGHVVGSHTYSHPMLTSLPHTAAVEEIRVGKQVLEDILGSEVTDFSYPFGMRRHFNNRLRKACAKMGIRTVASARPIPHAAPEPLAINRILWRLNRPMADNVDNLYIDGRIFEGLTGRSPVGD